MRLRPIPSPLCAAVLLVACAGPARDSADTARLDEVRGARASLDAARVALVAAGSMVSAPAASRGPDAARAAEAEGRLAAARDAFDRSYRRYQTLLAAFLETALTERPRAGSTREALGMYTKDAVSNARESLARGGAPESVRSTLARVVRYHDLAGVPPPAELTATLAAAQQGSRVPAAGTQPAGAR